MARIDYILVVTMAISLIWGIIVLALGAVVTLAIGMLISNYVSGLEETVALETSINSAGQNVCPVTTAVTNDIEFGSWLPNLGGFVMVCGALVVLFSALGFVAGLKRNNPLLMVMIVLIVVSAAIEYSLVQLGSTEDHSFHDASKDELTALIRENYMIDGQGHLFTETWNAIMLTGECCGVQGVRDFGNLTFMDKSRDDKIMILNSPPACCKRSLFTTNSPTSAYSLLIVCAMEPPDQMEKINTVGCYSIVFKYITDTHGPAILALLVFLAIWQMLQLILAVMLIFTPPPKARPSAVARVSQKPSLKEEEEKPVVKKFVPFSKISSFQHADLSRIKSTEIW